MSHTEVITDLPLAEDVTCTFFGCIQDDYSGGNYYPNKITDQCSLGKKVDTICAIYCYYYLFNIPLGLETTSSSLTFNKKATLHNTVDKTSKINVLSTLSSMPIYPFISA